MFLSLKKFFAATLLPCFLISGCAATPKSKNEPPSPPSQEQPVDEGVWQTNDVDIASIDPNKKLVALTFDDAPSSLLDGLLDVFISFNQAHPDCPASCTLFCNGIHLSPRKKESLLTAFTLGLELGNHAFSHRDLTTLSTEKIREEIRLVDEFLKEIDGKPRHLFRAPYGRLDERVLEIVQTPGVDWYIDTKDWAIRSAERLVDAVFSRLQDGAIILMHDGYESTVQGVKNLLPLLNAAGYQAVSVSQMAKAHGCHLKTGKVYTRARKQKA